MKTDQVAIFICLSIVFGIYTTERASWVRFVCLSHWHKRKKALKSSSVAEKPEVKGAGAFPHAENHLKCAQAAWDYISALVFQHLFLEKNPKTLISAKNTVVDEAGCPLLLTNVHSSTMLSHACANMRWPHGTYWCSGRQGGGVLEWSINGRC